MTYAVLKISKKILAKKFVGIANGCIFTPAINANTLMTTNTFTGTYVARHTARTSNNAVLQFINNPAAIQAVTKVDQKTAAYLAGKKFETVFYYEEDNQSDISIVDAAPKEIGMVFGITLHNDIIK